MAARISEESAQALGINVRQRGKSRYPVAPKEQRTIDGIVFDSKAEANRYSQHKVAERAGYISDLVLQPAFDFVYEGKKVFTYTADFAFTLARNGERVIEDVKSTGTAKERDFELRKKLIQLQHGIEIKTLLPGGYLYRRKNTNGPPMSKRGKLILKPRQEKAPS